MDHVLVTGAAGFIGFHLSKKLLSEGLEVTGLDNLNPYYEVSLKEARLEQLKKVKGFSFVKCSLEDRKAIEKVFQRHAFDMVVHLAAQAGVRYSIENPSVYIYSNLVGFLHRLEECRKSSVKHLVFASKLNIRLK